MSGPKPLRGVTAKEHAGGMPGVAVEFRGDDEQAIPVKWIGFDFSQLDSLTDLIEEAHAAGRPAGPIVAEVMRQHELAIATETLNQILGHIISSENPMLQCYALAFTCNVSIVQNITPVKAAEKLGVSKQDVYQAVDRLCEKLGLRKTQWMRDQEAKDQMSMSNYRKPTATEGHQTEKGDGIEK